MNEYFWFSITLTWGLIKSQIIQAKNCYKKKKWIMTIYYYSNHRSLNESKAFTLMFLCELLKTIIEKLFIIINILHSFIHVTWESWLSEYIWKIIIGSLPMKLWFETMVLSVLSSIEWRAEQYFFLFLFSFTLLVNHVLFTELVAMQSGIGLLCSKYIKSVVLFRLN